MEKGRRNINSGRRNKDSRLQTADGGRRKRCESTSAANCRLLSAVSFGAAGDWEWTDRGGVQAFDWEEVEADLGEVEGRKCGQDGYSLRAAIQ